MCDFTQIDGNLFEISNYMQYIDRKTGTYSGDTSGYKSFV